MRGISDEVYLRRVTKEIVEIIELVWLNSLVDAVFVVIGALRDHRRCGDIGGIHVVNVADKCLRVEAEGISHETSHSIDR